MIGRSPPLRALLARLETIAESVAPVLLSGETGTGKELIARLLHDRSSRRGKPFVALACASFPETLIEAELFGYERGAFTGAAHRREGRIKAADKGTLFLDEVAEMSLAVQAKLLRVLQESLVDPIGTNTPVSVDVRIVSATHRDLRRRVREGSFREDLFYRLNVLELTVPPLRERREDLPLLVEDFVERAVSRGGKRPTGISAAAWKAIGAHTFPGNVRELQHAVEHAVVLAAGGEIDVLHLPSDVRTGAERPPKQASLRAATRAYERQLLTQALQAANGKRAVAARLLGISRKSLWEKLRAHDLADDDAVIRH